MKKLIALPIAALTAVSANAGIYISPKVSLSDTKATEQRIETKSIDGSWSEFAGNKQESWNGKGTQVSPKFAVGYEFDLQAHGIFSIEAEYGSTENYFNGVSPDVDLEGSIPNDSDTRNFSYDEQTISLNAKYGYSFKYAVPFITAGIGYSAIESVNNFRSGTYWWETKDQEKNLSWNIGAGIEIPVDSNLSLTLAYLYTDLGNLEYSNAMYHNKGTTEGIERMFNSSVDLTKQELVAGIKIKF